MLATLEHASLAGWTFSVWAPEHGPLADELRRRDVEVLPAAPGDLGQRRQQLADLLRRRSFDLVHANSLAMGRLSGPVAVAAGVPSLSHLRDIVRLSAQAIADLNCHSRLLAVSDATRRWHVGQGLDAEKTHVQYNGVDLERFRPRPKSGQLLRELGLSPQSLLLGTIGQICLRKGHDVLVQAACRLAERWPQAHYVLVGERWSQKDESREFEAALRRASEGLLAGRVHLLGPRDDVDRLLAELDLVVHPARQEPLGRVLLESAAAGVAVVATDVGGTPEIFPIGSDTALLVPPGDPDALAAAIDRLLGDPALRSQLGLAARRRSEQTFDIRRRAAELVEHYQAVGARL